MSAQLIDGKVVAESVYEDVKRRITQLADRGVTPGLAAVLVGEDPASATYVRSKAKMCKKLGLYSDVITLPVDTTHDELVHLVHELNKNPKIHGILVQSPLPPHIDEPAITLEIDPRKDVDGFHPHNVGLMLIGKPGLLPCTPYGIIKMLEYYKLDPAGKEVVVVGRSNIVGKPIAGMLVQKADMANATVTIAHSRTKDLREVTLRGDILIAAIGRAGIIAADMVKQGAIVIDVGINRIDDPNAKKGYRIVGDVDFEACSAVASHITPVPGGVGRMTIAMLMSNTVDAAEQIAS